MRPILPGMDARLQVLAKLGKRLRETRTARGMSQEVLAQLAGLNRHYVNQVECGRRNVSILNLVKIAEALAVDLAVLMAGISKK
ncbi:MAG TPA: helix-turn-helix domain-containing protein [Thermoanaerobaculia bacterium]|jgi:transcriptional regulator with XRE-family HTH domain|nr:helix-turn-helix domain-containing protein [Thermoanaerobaculia bacterium]